MSSTQQRDTRHRGMSEDFRELHSFLTCRLTHGFPCSAREEVMTWRKNRISRHAGYQTGETRRWIGNRNVLPAEFSPGDLAALFAEPSEQTFETGFVAELFAFREIVFGSAPAPGWLRHPRIAETAQRTLHALDGVLCRLDAFVILPTHAHLVFTQHPGLHDCPTPADVADAFKAAVRQQAPRYLLRNGSFWEEHDYHRSLPDESAVREAVIFIRDAPVRGGLVETPLEWEWLYVRPALQ